MEKLPCGGFSGLLPENGLIEGINHDDLEVLVGRILANPVGAQDTDSLDTTIHSLLSDGLQVPDGFQLGLTGFNWIMAPEALGWN